jgi:hypothetical protein
MEMNAKEELELFEALKLKSQIDETDCENFLKKFENELADNIDRFAFILHLVMIQNGFTNDNSKSINKTSSFIMFAYNNYINNHPRAELKLDTNISLVANLMRNINKITIQIFFKRFKSNLIVFTKTQIDSLFSNHQSKLNVKALYRLINEFKDSVQNPLKVFLLKESDFDELLKDKSVIYLPSEILLNIIVEYLDIKSIMKLSATCKYFNDFIVNKSAGRVVFTRQIEQIPPAVLHLWKQLVLRDFPNKKYLAKEDNMHATNWYSYRRIRARLRLAPA